MLNEIGEWIEQDLEEECYLSYIKDTNFLISEIMFYIQICQKGVSVGTALRAFV